MNGSAPYPPSISPKAQELFSHAEKHKLEGDLDKAHRYYEEALKHGHPLAQEQMDGLPAASSNWNRKKQKMFTEPVIDAWEDEKNKRRAGKVMASLINAFSKNLNLEEPFFSTQPSISSVAEIGETTELQQTSNFLVKLFKSSHGQVKIESYSLIKETVAQFNSDRVNLATIHELVVLSTTSDKDIYLQILSKILEVINNSQFLPNVLPHGLAVVLSNVPDIPENFDMYTLFTTILRKILIRLPKRGAESSESELFPQLRALTVLLDAMVYRRITGVDRNDVYIPLRERLVELGNHKNPTISFLAKYARQGLVYVGSDETIGEDFSRRVCLVLGLVGNIGDIITGDTSKVEESFKQLRDICDVDVKASWYQRLLFLDCIMGKQDWEQVDIFIRNRIRKPSSQSETRFLRGACLRLEQIAATQPIEIRKGAIKMLIFLSNNVDQKVKDVAQDVLKRLGEDNDSRSPGNQSVALASSDELYNYQANQDSLPPIWDPYWRSTSKSILLQREMERRNLPNLLQQICEKTQQTYDFAQASNETTLQLSEGQNVMMQQMSQVHNGQQTLTHQFHEVQQAVQHNQIGHQALAQQFQNGQQDIIQGQQTILREFMMHRLHNNRLVTQRRFQHIETHLISPSPYNQIEYNNSENQLANVNFYIEELKKAFNVYYTPNLVLKSISGEKSKINLDTCDIELAILSAPHQRGHDNSILEFHKETDKKKEPRQQGPSAICEKPKVQVKDLFTSKNENGEVHLLNKLLIQGRAGIGKTTLCKRIVYSHQKGMWTDKFDVVFWLPLRELKIYEARTLDKLLLEKYFPHNRYKDELVMIFRYLMAQGRVLFVLDGLDEIVIEAQIDANMPLKSFIVSLLEQSHVIVTARPSGVEMSILSGKLETELETVGFNEVNVEEYVKKFFPEDAKSAQDILNFIGSNEFLQTLVNVPVQLEVVCFGWSDLSKGPKVSKFSRPSTPQAPVPITVTGLYQAMVYKLLRKDIMQLGKALNGKPYGQAQTLSEQQVERLQPYQIDTIMEIEVTYLSYLSFTGLKDGYVIEFSETHLGETTMGLDDLRKYAGINEFLPFDLIDQLKQTSFLHSADTEMMEGRETLSDSWHFLHLTFQEFFAAKWIARHFGLKKSIPNSKAIVVMTPEEMTEFINTNKFNARYEIVWSMLAGLLAGMENGKLLLEEFFDMLEINDSKFKHDDRVRILEGCFREAKHKLAEDRIRRLEIEIGLNQREE